MGLWRGRIRALGSRSHDVIWQIVNRIEGATLNRSNYG